MDLICLAVTVVPGGDTPHRRTALGWVCLGCGAERPDPCDCDCHRKVDCTRHRGPAPDQGWHSHDVHPKVYWPAFWDATPDIRPCPAFTVTDTAGGQAIVFCGGRAGHGDLTGLRRNPHAGRIGPFTVSWSADAQS